MSLKWLGIVRDKTVPTEGCTIGTTTRYCYAYPTSGGGACSRTGAGIGRWMDNHVPTGAVYSELSKGYRANGIKPKEGQEAVEWGQLLDGVLKESIGSAYDESSNEYQDDRYLKLPTRRMWKGLMDADNTGRCKDNAGCQKMLYFIGCLVYSLLAPEERIIDNSSESYLGCQRILNKLLKETTPTKLETVEGQYYWGGEKYMCQMSTGFRQCKIEVLSFLIGVSKTLRKLCPQCKQTDLRAQLTEHLNCGKDQGIYCPENRQGGNIRCRAASELPKPDLEWIIPPEITKKPVTEAAPGTATSKNEIKREQEGKENVHSQTGAQIETAREMVRHSTENSKEEEGEGSKSKEGLSPKEVGKESQEKEAENTQKEHGPKENPQEIAPAEERAHPTKSGEVTILDHHPEASLEEAGAPEMSVDSGVVGEGIRGSTGNSKEPEEGNKPTEIWKGVAVSIGLIAMVVSVGYGGYRIYGCNSKEPNSRERMKSKKFVGYLRNT
ncbi:hypothetical protein C922_04649 [Plasmodium inui San Antonio 1]|uniref:Uncharacterized protein n=1 Tax=Plasmodium inui San Antonio 1 TaxID=1237626 RepID=W6ZVV5_9APIC|nr:hypothetical protein C922_04649 [Plasmodium inui San Antonio 1]EUD64917.1 hypothetical protein C922_04649 [Plasmodium inui San Antonio 1]